MVVDKEVGKIVVNSLISGSPAEKAGIVPGDYIVSVDGVEYTSDDFNIISNYIKGKEGTTVNLGIERKGESLSFDIVREKIAINPITSKMLEGNVGYVNLSSFDENTSNEFKIKVQELEQKGAKSLIIDLRNNGGGIVNEATNIADFMLDKGKTIITTVDNKNNKESTYSKDDPIFDMPIVVLTNKNSASASEILVCSLADNNRATIVGTTTYGKGIIQTVLSLSDGSGLKITTHEYYTPNGEKIHKVGIEPDEEVKLPDTVKNLYSVEEKDDTQLQKALDLLKE